MLRRWAITLGATAISTYALDAIATVAGVALAASQLLDGLGHGVLLAVLAASYVAWGAGLRVNLAANWRLLEETGTSTNALSKAARDIAARRTRSARAQRLAASAGYVGHRAREGGAVLRRGVRRGAQRDGRRRTTRSMFLAGANLGAALYEYGLARLTRAFLAARTSRAAA